MKKSVQLYSIRLLCEKDLEQGLKAVSELGYDGVEFASLYDNSAETVKSWLIKYNLEVQGAHVAPELMFDEPEKTIEYHKAIGNTRIICPWYDIKTIDDVMELVRKIKAVAPLYKAAGMKLYYHNHAHEFQKHEDKYFIDILAENTTADELSLEFDVYWVFRGGENPVDYLTKYADRIDIFHAKDGTMDSDAPVGMGELDFPAIFETAKKIGAEWAVIESEADSSAEAQVEDIKICIENVKKYI